MSEYTEVEQPFLQQLETLGWISIDQDQDIPQDPNKSLRKNFRQWVLPDIFEKAVSAINTTNTGEEWLTQKQLHDLYDQILRHPKWLVFYWVRDHHILMEQGILLRGTCGMKYQMMFPKKSAEIFKKKLMMAQRV